MWQMLPEEEWRMLKSKLDILLDLEKMIKNDAESAERYREEFEELTNLKEV